MENADLPECERDAKRSLFLLLASLILGPFTLIPAIIYAHRARRDTASIRRKKTMAALVIGYAACAYSLVILGMFLLPPRTISGEQSLLPYNHKKVGEKVSPSISDSN